MKEKSINKLLLNASLIDELNSRENNAKFTKYRELWKLAANYKILTNFPMHLDIELSAVCNLQCSHCFQNDLIKNKLGLMSWDLYKQIIDEGVSKGLCAIKLQIRGESMLHPKIFDAISYAKKRGIMDVQLTTNATMINRNSSKQLIESGLDGIIFSVDTHHEESFYEKYKNNNYNNIKDAVQIFLDTRLKLNSKKPWVRLQVAVENINPITAEETKKYIYSIYPLADIIVINRMHNFKENEPGYPDLHTNYHQLPCEYLYHRLAIFYDGTVTVCCVDYNNRFNLGKFPDLSIEDIWHSEKMNRLRTTHHAGKRHEIPLCHYCNTCSVPINDHNQHDATPRHAYEN